MYRHLNVVVWSPPLYSRGGTKWQDNYPEGLGHPVTPNCLVVKIGKHVCLLCVQKLASSLVLFLGKALRRIASIFEWLDW